MDIKNNWKETGEELSQAFVSLGKTLVKTVAAGIRKAEEWANEDTPPADSAEKKNETNP